MALVKPTPDAPPARSMPGMGDHPTAIALFGAIAMALYRRERTGEGGSVTTSLLANGLWSNAIMVQAALCGGTVEPRPGRDAADNALNNLPGDGFDVSNIGHFRVSHDGGRVAVDQHHFIAFFAKRFTGLST